MRRPKGEPLEEEEIQAPKKKLDSEYQLVHCIIQCYLRASLGMSENIVHCTGVSHTMSNLTLGTTVEEIRKRLYLKQFVTRRSSPQKMISAKI